MEFDKLCSLDVSISVYQSYQGGFSIQWPQAGHLYHIVTFLVIPQT